MSSLNSSFERYLADNVDPECPHCGDSLTLDEDDLCFSCGRDPGQEPESYPDDDELHERYLEYKYDF